MFSADPSNFLVVIRHADIHPPTWSHPWVVVFCHQPVHAPDKPKSVVWNAEELLDAVHASGNVVVWLAGHDHSGQYSRDKKGVHHLVPPAPLDCRPPNEVAYGHVEVREVAA